MKHEGGVIILPAQGMLFDTAEDTAEEPEPGQPELPGTDEPATQSVVEPAHA